MIQVKDTSLNVTKPTDTIATMGCIGYVYIHHLSASFALLFLSYRREISV